MFPGAVCIMAVVALQATRGSEFAVNAATLYQCAMSEAWGLDFEMGNSAFSEALGRLQDFRDAEANRLMAQSERIAWFVRKAAQQPHCTWPIRLGPFMALGQHQEARRLMRIMRGRVRYLTAHQRGKEACAEWLAMLRLIERVQDPPCLLTHLISAAVFLSWCEVGAECAPYWSAEERQAAVRALERVRLPEWARAFQREHEIVEWIFKQRRMGLAGWKRLLELGRYLGSEAHPFVWVPEPILRMSQRRYVELIGEFAALLDLPLEKFRQGYKQWQARVAQVAREPIGGIFVRLANLSNQQVFSEFAYDHGRRVKLYRELVVLGLRSVDEGPAVARGAKSQVTGQTVQYRPTRYGFVLETDLPLAERVHALLGEQVILLRFGSEYVAPPEREHE